MKEYVVKFDYKDMNAVEVLPNSDVIKKAMELEYVKIYNIFCDITNEGVIDRLNKKFSGLYPDYKLADNLWDSKEYIDYFRKGYTEVVNKLNNLDAAKILEYYIGEELELHGRLKVFNLKGDISFHLEEA